MRYKRFLLTAVAPAAALALAAPPHVPTAHAADQYEWAAPGDSCTAGIFTGKRADSPDGCERTPGSCPDLVREDLTEFPPGMSVRLSNASCGNAANPHIARESQTPIGWGFGVDDPAEPSGGWAAGQGLLPPASPSVDPFQQPHRGSLRPPPPQSVAGEAHPRSTNASSTAE